MWTMETRTSTIDVHVDGRQMAVFVARPAEGDGGPVPGVAIGYEGFGMTDYIRETAGALAGRGYVVCVPDLYHRVGRMLSVPYTEYTPAAQANLGTPLDSRRLMSTLRDDLVLQDFDATFEY